MASSGGKPNNTVVRRRILCPVRQRINQSGSIVGNYDAGLAMSNRHQCRWIDGRGRGPHDQFGTVVESDVGPREVSPSPVRAAVSARYPAAASFRKCVFGRLVPATPSVQIRFSPFSSST